MILRASLSLILILLLGSAPAAAAPRRGGPSRPLIIAVVTDGPLTPTARRMLDQIKAETADVLKGRRAVAFPADKQIIGSWSPAAAERANDTLLGDPAVDLVLVFGLLSTANMAERAELNKPVLAPMAVDPRFTGLPERQGTSGKKNFNYLVYLANFAEDIRVLRELTGARRIHVLVDELFLRRLPHLQQMASRVGQQEKVELIGVPVKPEPKGAVAALPADAHAVFVTPLVRMSDAQRAALYQELIRRKLPSFSMIGRSEILQGALATQTRGVDFLRIARRTALNIERVVRGENPATFPIHLKRNARLILNADTARAIDFAPGWEILTYAEIYSAKGPNGDGRRLTLGRAMNEALERNWDVLAAAEGVNAEAQRVKTAWSSLYPQLSFSFEHQTVRQKVAEASLGSVPQHRGTFAGQASQVLFVEPLVATISIRKHQLRAARFGYQTTRLDVVAQTAQSYLDLLRAQAFARIQRHNAQVTLENLEAARVRRKVGVTGPTDVYRWESQLAVDRRNAISAHAAVEAAGYQLNRLLRRPQTEPIAAVAPGEDDPTLLPRFKELPPYLANPKRLEIFADFVVREGLAAAPELRELEAVVAAQERLHRSNRHALYLPRLQLTGQLSYDAYREGGESDLALPANLQFDFPSAPELQWFVGIGLSLPVFTGFSQWAELKRAGHELSRRKHQLRSARLGIENRIRAAMTRARAAYAAIRFSEQSAEAARKNLEVVSNAYAQGVVETVTLLDAQNNALSAELAAATAVFDFLKSVVEIQRASGRFELFISGAERDAWFDRLDNFFRERGERIASSAPSQGARR